MKEEVEEKVEEVEEKVEEEGARGVWTSSITMLSIPSSSSSHLSYAGTTSTLPAEEEEAERGEEKREVGEGSRKEGERGGLAVVLLLLKEWLIVACEAAVLAWSLLWFLLVRFLSDSDEAVVDDE